MEVVSGRLTYETRVSGNPAALAKDVRKLVDEKLAQLSKRTQQLLDNVIGIGEVDIARTERVWPMIVVAEGLIAAEPLWADVNAKHAGTFSDSRVQPLAIIDGYELELLMALVEEGHALRPCSRPRPSRRGGCCPSAPGSGPSSRRPGRSRGGLPSSSGTGRRRGRGAQEMAKMSSADSSPS